VAVACKGSQATQNGCNTPSFVSLSQASHTRKRSMDKRHMPTLSCRAASSKRPILLRARPQQQRRTLLAGLMVQPSSKWPKASANFSCFIMIWPKPYLQGHTRAHEAMSAYG